MSEPSIPKRFLVLGIGPAGGIFAAHLANAGASVFAIDPWAEHTKAVKEKGLTLTGHTAITSQLAGLSTELSAYSDQEFDYAVIAVKTPQLAEAVAVIENLSGKPAVVSLQNGLDNEDFLGRHLGKDRVLRVVVNYAGMMRGPGVIEMTWFQPPNYIGCICGDEGCMAGQELAGMMTQAELQTKSVDDIKRFTWRKTILNAALSPVSSVMGLTMAEVMGSREGYQLVEMLLKECIAVAQAAGYSFGDGFYDHCLDYLQRGGRHKPSMLIDLENHKQTEIDYINGKIDSYGYELNIPVPVNTVLTALVRAKERQLVQDCPD